MGLEERPRFAARLGSSGERLDDLRVDVDWKGAE
jgi:hypothetical protein